MTDYQIRLIAHRCPELGQEVTASIEAVMPPEIAEQIMDAIAALEDKLDWLAERVGVNRDDADDDATRRRAGA